MKLSWINRRTVTTLQLILLLGGNLLTAQAGEKGMTWAFRHYYSDIDTTYVHCYGEPGSPNYGPCNPYQGDTSCSTPLPVLCLKVDGSTRPPYEPLPPGGGMNKEYYTGWAEGAARLTDPIPGNTFTSLGDVNAYCEAQLGSGYRTAEFHDGRWVSGMDENNFYSETWPLTTSSGGWGFNMPGHLPDDSRFWVHINDQNANCWDKSTAQKGSIGDQVWADLDEDGNGVLDGDDYPLSGVKMLLYDSDGNLIRETVTYDNGKYLFSNLDYGTYTVEVDQTTLPSNMQDNVAYDHDGQDDGVSVVTVDSLNSNSKNQDFAFYSADGNTTPLADAGEGQSVIQGEEVCFDGSGSSDADNDELEYLWSLTAWPVGSSAVLDNSTAVTPCITADIPGTYEVGLTVHDGFAYSEPDTVSVIAIAYLDAATESLLETVTAVNEIDLVDFKNKNMRNALTNQINAALSLIDQGDYAEALGKLQNSILGKTDGCAVSEPSVPDKNDWIRDCESQDLVYPLIIEAIDYLEEI